MPLGLTTFDLRTLSLTIKNTLGVITHRKRAPPSITIKKHSVNGTQHNNKNTTLLH
jgi:hypothetical protein